MARRVADKTITPHRHFMREVMERDPRTQERARLFRQGQVSVYDAAEHTVDIIVKHDLDLDLDLTMESIPVIASYKPKVGDWVEISYNGDDQYSAFISGAGMAPDVGPDAMTSMAEIPPARVSSADGDVPSHDYGWVSDRLDAMDAWIKARGALAAENIWTEIQHFSDDLLPTEGFIDLGSSDHPWQYLWATSLRFQPMAGTFWPLLRVDQIDPSTADRQLFLGILGDASVRLNIGGDASAIDQDLRVAAGPVFGNLHLPYTGVVWWQDDPPPFAVGLAAASLVDLTTNKGMTLALGTDANAQLRLSGTGCAIDQDVRAAAGPTFDHMHTGGRIRFPGTGSYEVAFACGQSGVTLTAERALDFLIAGNRPYQLKLSGGTSTTMKTIQLDQNLRASDSPNFWSVTFPAGGGPTFIAQTYGMDLGLCLVDEIELGSGVYVYLWYNTEASEVGIHLETADIGLDQSLRTTEDVSFASLITTGQVQIGGDLNHDGTKAGFFGTAPVVRAAAYTITNVTPDRAYDADTVAIAELADVVGTLVADLKTYGLLQ